MAGTKTTEIIRFLRKLLGDKGIRVDKIMVFGSQGKGTSKRNSDLDLAIISKAFEGKDVFEKADILSGIEWELTQRFMIPFDIVALSPDEWEKDESPLVSFVREGKVVYG